jgi:SAM-dependent methyltransferase
MNDGFYRAFEEKYRGSRELIMSRLRVYLPFIEPLLGLYEETQGIDLGCGRGEWLELLEGAGFQACGVDVDAGMLAVCHERGLNVETKDAIEALKGLPDASQVVVSGFHIIEHLSFSELKVLVQEALRVLKPAGLLILETPNPENLVVGTANFYFDPTHQRPIPPQLLSFLPEYFGFSRVKVIRLQESTDLALGNELRLMDVLDGVSPDYAVIAQKAAKPEVMAATDAAFEINYGYNLEDLATRFSQNLEKRVNRAEAVAQSAEVHAQHFSAELRGVYASHSWRITMPLRVVGKWGLGFVAQIKGLVKKIAGQILSRTILFISAHPTLRSRCVALALQCGFYSPLLSLYWRFMNKFYMMKTSGKPAHPITPCESTAQLSPRARCIYDELKIAIERNTAAR